MTEKDTALVLKGSVEGIVYRNEENDYTVLEIITEQGELHTAVGMIAAVAEGEDVILYGNWVKHAEYGLQFSFDAYELALPDNSKAILRYLSSGVIKSVGPVTAARIVTRYGEDTFEVIEKHPEWLAQISGITLKKAAKIHDSFAEQSELRSLMLLCRSFLSTSIIGKIYRKWGSDAVDILKENPYIVCQEIGGVSFASVDSLAFALAFQKDAPERLESGLCHLLSYNAQANGHTALPFSKLKEAAVDYLEVSAEKVEEAIKSALRKGMLVAWHDEKQMLSLASYASAEKFIKEKLERLDKACALYSDSEISLFIRHIEEETGLTYAHGQRLAIRAALQNGVMLLTGGPGTGKTTVIRALLHIFSFAGFSVQLVAPTGRAANRMSEATSCEAKTVHRALEMEKSDEKEPIFRRNATNPLDAGVIIVDEMSMMDSLLMSALLSAVKQGSRLILIGDADQLPSVGAGNVLHDLLDSQKFFTVHLNEIFRQSEESLIVVNAHRINRGELPILNRTDKDFFYLPTREDQVPRVIADLIHHRLPKAYGEEIREQIQIITPSRKGIAGTEQLNRFLQQAQNPPSKRKKEIKHHGIVLREGDRVMQVRNNYELEWQKNGKEGSGVFNGETGRLVEVSPESASVVFADKEAVYTKEYMEDLEHAYAITIHKSQGSEYPVVIMPLCFCPPLLANRHLLYTAVTRARDMVIFVGNKEIVARMVENNRDILRYTALSFLLGKGEKGANT
ncbi:MAG: ATP-dependent RecD-like DNA helicase [Clostridia bacterium]|nr:ATP-dependent RecD-like DNA helicase [Clostridia bacterium]